MSSQYYYRNDYGLSSPNISLERVGDYIVSLIETQHMGLIGNRSHTEAIAKKLIKLVDIIESGKNT
jgi:Na+/phosphate symporter